MWPTIKQLIDGGLFVCEVISGDSDSLYRSVCRAEVVDLENSIPEACTNELLFLTEKACQNHNITGTMLQYAAGLVVPRGILTQGFDFSQGIQVPVFSCNAERMVAMAAACNEHILRRVSLFLSGELPPQGYKSHSSLYFSSVLENALNGMRYSDSAMDSISHSARMFPPTPYTLVLIQAEPQEDVKVAEAVLSTVGEVIERYRRGIRLPVSVRGNEIVLLMPVSDSVESAGWEDAVKDFILEVRAGCNATLSVCFSDSFPNINYIHTSYQSVMFSLALNKEMYGAGGTVSYAETGMYLYLLKRVDFPGMTYMFDKYWGQLQEYDIANKTELSKTLDTYVRLSGKSAETADMLGIHRNTMRNRLNFIGRLLNVDTSNPETVFQLALAQKLKAIMKAAIVSGVAPAVETDSMRGEGFELPLSKEIVAAYDMLSRHDVSGERVAEALAQAGLNYVTVRRVSSGDSYSDFIRIVIPGTTGKARGMNSPTLGVVGRLGGIKLVNQPLSLISDADGAIAAIALALKLAPMCASKTGPMGDVIITTQIALSSSSKAHKPAALALSAIDIKTACAYEYDENMDALLSLTVCRATRWVNIKGIAITPTVMGGTILPPCEDLLSILETVTSRSPVVFPITDYDITPEGNGLYHINSIMQHSTVARCPVVGVALTSAGLIPGVTLRHNDLADAELATRFALEAAFGFTAGNVTLYDKEEFQLSQVRRRQFNSLG